MITRVVETLLLFSFDPRPLQAELPALSQSKIRKVAAYSVALSCCAAPLRSAAQIETPWHVSLIATAVHPDLCSKFSHQDTLTIFMNS
ncbi:uncharacterized protein B0J16DRAFT_336319 [Fusarium flagelliforme]|uniref:uncharacterized protein n=1 Tax=Fusarium flagelliforme TaxID=2675880 RepID=UPI001E8E4020|nr:uncharacterized protein B0J16DRAFT_336319 [Fusarium flagelliforme]KAH7193982.1 hypothetical protein B0J16DRAFT_336319 [Fusarium flagelliforme]